MKNTRKSTLLAGILYLASFVAGMLSIAYAADDPAYLTRAAIESTQTTWAAVFQFMVTMAYLGIAALLYPIVKKTYEGLALAFLSFSITGAVSNILGIIMLMLILTLSIEYINTPDPNQGLFRLIGSLLHTGRDLINHFTMVVTQCMASIMLYLLLYKKRMVPGWLSLWGIAGSVMAISGSACVLFNQIDVLTPAYMVINVPLVLQEIVFAGWLICKGFSNPSSINRARH